MNFTNFLTFNELNNTKSGKSLAPLVLFAGQNPMMSFVTNFEIAKKIKGLEDTVDKLTAELAEAESKPHNEKLVKKLATMTEDDIGKVSKAVGAKFDKANLKSVNAQSLADAICQIA